MTVKERTEADILSYIQRNAIDGKMAKSLLEIGAEVGYSNATVHRAMTRLQESGLIELTRDGCRANEPSIIRYTGPESADNMLTQGLALLSQVKQSADALVQHYQQGTAELEQVYADAAAWRSFQERVVGRTTLANGNQLITICPKHGPGNRVH